MYKLSPKFCFWERFRIPDLWHLWFSFIYLLCSEIFIKHQQSVAKYLNLMLTFIVEIIHLSNTNCHCNFKIRRLVNKSLLFKNCAWGFCVHVFFFPTQFEKVKIWVLSPLKHFSSYKNFLSLVWRKVVFKMNLCGLQCLYVQSKVQASFVGVTLFPVLLLALMWIMYCNYMVDEWFDCEFSFSWNKHYNKMRNNFSKSCDVWRAKYKWTFISLHVLQFRVRCLFFKSYSDI